MLNKLTFLVATLLLAAANAHDNHYDEKSSTASRYWNATSSRSPPCPMELHLYSIGDTKTITSREACNTFRVNGPRVASNLYVIFTKINMFDGQKIKIRELKGNGNDHHHDQHEGKKLAECEGDTTFCAPIILLEGSAEIELPVIREGSNHVEIVVVASEPVPRYYYAYSQFPAWATLSIVVSTLAFCVLGLLVCCCCLAKICNGRRHRCRRAPSPTHQLPDGPPVYTASAQPIVLNIPPMHMSPPQNARPASNAGVNNDNAANANAEQQQAPPLFYKTPIAEAH